MAEEKSSYVLKNYVLQSQITNVMKMFNFCHSANMFSWFTWCEILENEKSTKTTTVSLTTNTPRPTSEPKDNDYTSEQISSENLESADDEGMLKLRANFNGKESGFHFSGITIT